MECLEIKKALDAWADREVSPEVSEKMELHLKECRECRTEANEMNRIFELLNAMPTIPAPYRLVRRTMKAFRAMPRAEANWNEWWRHLNFLMRCAAFAFALIGLVSGILLDQNMRGVTSVSAGKISYINSLYQIKEVLP